MNLEDVTHKYNKATKYLNKGKIEYAFRLYKDIISKYPCKEAYTNIGNCYRARGEDKEMFAAYKAALLPSTPYLDPSSGTELHALNNLGLAYYMYGNDDKAIEYYTRAISKDPEFWEAWWNCSTATLRKASSGSVELFPRGWQMYQSRFLKNPPIKLKNKRSGLVYWDGVSCGEDIVVLAEQGIGDSIMFGRFLSSLQKKFKRVFVQCDPSLRDIFYQYNCVFDPSEIESSNLVAYPMCGLAEHLEFCSGDWLRGSFDTFDFGSGLNVGIVWAGSRTHSNNRYRSTTVERFHPLSAHCNLYSLDPTFKGDRHVRALPISSWSDTAKYINGLDLIIGVDTSVMHMAGALGARGLLLQPYKETDFRWGNGVSESVWYSGIEVISNPQSWDTVFSTVKERICSL